MAIPQGLTRTHVEQAIQSLDSGTSHPFGASVDYDVMFNGKSYPPKAVVGIASSIATGRQYGPNDFSAGEGAGQTNSVLRSLGFQVVRRDAGADVAFTASDSSLFERTRQTSNWVSLNAADQESLRGVRLRLKAVAQRLAPIAGAASVPMASFVSTLAPSGRVPRLLWSCVFPQTVPNKSFALQFAVIINASGAEVCCCLGAGTAQVNAPEIVQQSHQALAQLRTRLGSVPADVQDSLALALGDRWQLRTSWLREPGRRDFNSIHDWLNFAASDQGASASISRNVTPDELERQGSGFVDDLVTEFALFAPLFRHAYAGTPTIINDAEPYPNRPVDGSLHPKLFRELTQLHADLTSRGELLSIEALNRYYETFRRRFGPDVLRGTNGEALLTLMHETGRDNLVYWLEFKDDDEFPARFGSIAGGSALKYGLYRRKETGAWMTGRSTAQTEISTTDAVRIAQRHRDQLLAACDVLSALSGDVDDQIYSRLQEDLRRVAPDVEDSAWGHKYLSLLYPDRLDDFHAAPYQRFHLIKLLEIPPEGEGRYLAAGRYIALTREFEWPVNHLATVLNRRNGPPHRYWRVGTRDSANKSHWPMMREEALVAIGWAEIGNLSEVLATEDVKEAVRAALGTTYPTMSPQLIGRSAQQITNFCRAVAERDYVLACDGARVLAVGRVTGGYLFDASHVFPHRRPVEWLDVGEWQLPTVEGLQTTVHEFKNSPENLVAIETRVIDASGTITRPTPARPIPVASSTVSIQPKQWTGRDLIGRIQDVLDRKSQVILYGPPGTGKTYWAERAATELASLWNFGRQFNQLSDSDRSKVFGPHDTYVRFCCFHPAYGYEDFIEGYRPTLVNENVHFEHRGGVFRDLCEVAARNQSHRYYLIVDEINRGDIPRIFGELLTLLDRPKRGTPMKLPVSRELFAVPPNVFLIGTMNTADRSIALLDTALRRRFGFIELMPDPDVLGDTIVGGIPLGPWLRAMNRLIATYVGRDGRNLQIGHSYFMQGGRPIQEFGHFARVLQEDILPLLEEYCYDDWDTLERILKSGLVNVADRCFKAELFEPNRQDALVQAILAATLDINASSIAVAAQAAEESTPAVSPDDEGEDEVV